MTCTISGSSKMFQFTDNMTLKGYTVILPSLSIGNVPQLAIDLIIESLKMKKIGFAFHAAIVPVLGAPAFSHDPSETTSCDVFVSEEKKLLAVQIRSPITAKLLDSFLEALIKFVSSTDPKEVIVLGSCFSHERHDDALTRKLEYVANEEFCKLYGSKLTDYIQKDAIKMQAFALKLYQALSNKLEVPLALLYAYVSEGDNVPDAKDLALFLNHVLNVIPATNPSQLPLPASWTLLFGNAGPAEIF